MLKLVLNPAGTIDPTATLCNILSPNTIRVNAMSLNATSGQAKMADQACQNKDRARWRRQFIEKARNEMMGRFLGSLDGTTLDN